MHDVVSRDFPPRLAQPELVLFYFQPRNGRWKVAERWTVGASGGSDWKGRRGIVSKHGRGDRTVCAVRNIFTEFNHTRTFVFLCEWFCGCGIVYSKV